MEKRVKIILLIAIPSTILLAIITNLTLSTSAETVQYKKLTSDLVTLELIVRAKQLNEIPVKTYLTFVDSVSQAASKKKIYSPFVKRPDLKPVVVETRKPSELDFIHTIKSGETLSSIAEMYQVSQRLIASINGIYDARQLQIGQRLTIPGSATVSKRQVTFRRPTGIIVNGIIWDESKPNAVINGEVYQVGDSFNRYTIHSMTDTSVVFVSEVDTFSANYSRE